MRTKIINFTERLRSSYWFIPAIMMVAAILLSFGTIAIDHFLNQKQLDILQWTFFGGPQAIDSLLSTIAGSMISVAGVTFSITIVALSLASSQFGPRLLNSFIRDRGNQFSLGTFIATFLYAILVLRTLRVNSDDQFIPHLSASMAVLLAIFSLGILIYFFHHVSVSIIAENLIASVGNDLDIAIKRFFPEKRASQYWETFIELQSEEDIPKNFDKESATVTAKRSGYLQAIDEDGLLNLAKSNDLLLYLTIRPGDFVIYGMEMMKVWPPDKMTDELSDTLDKYFIVGSQRFYMQDVEYAINQLVEIAVRSLSPGINDPFTAIACINRLGVSISILAERSFPSAYHYDSENNLRLITDKTTFSGVLDSAFNQIRQYGRDSVAVTIRLLETIAIIAAHTNNREHLKELLTHARMIKTGADESLPEINDRNDVEKRFKQVSDILSEVIDVDATINSDLVHQ